MKDAVPLTIKVSASVKRELQRTAKQRGLRTSAVARRFLEEGLVRHRRGGLLGAGKEFVAKDKIKAGEPAFDPEDWANS